MHSYTERSPSGKGLHILFRAENFQYNTAQYYIMNHDAGIKVYVARATSKYVTVTGDRVNDYAFGERSKELEEVLNRFMQRPKVENQISENYGVNVVNGENSLYDEVVLEKARHSQNGQEFSHLWAGQLGQYPSHSEADLALCCELAFWTHCNRQQMGKLFRQSGTTYGAITIEKAISSCREVYQSPTLPPIS